MGDRPAFDAEMFKQTTRAQWESAAEAWNRWGPFIGRWLTPGQYGAQVSGSTLVCCKYWTSSGGT